MFALIKQHYGRVVDSPGDNILAEFSSVVDAVQGAVAIQKELKTRNDNLPNHRRMEFRIGINLGDVIFEQGQLFGDGVNIAARLESLSDAGGICISRTAFDQIEDKLPLGYEYLGEQEAKNMAKPLRAYKVNIWQEASVTGRIKERFSKRKHKKTKHHHHIKEAEPEKPMKFSKFYRSHLRAYLGIIIFLFIINMLTGPGYLWFIWPALGWGMVLFLHWVKVSD